VRNSESNIAIEKIDPYDSHLLLETFLGVDEKYRNYQESPCILFREMIRVMWPELLEWSINPPYTMREKIQSWLTKMGVYDLLRTLKYQLVTSNTLGKKNDIDLKGDSIGMKRRRFSGFVDKWWMPLWKSGCMI